MSRCKVLWSTNVIIGEAARLMGISAETAVTWLDQLLDLLKLRVQLVVVFPTERVEDVKHLNGNDVRFVAIPRSSSNGFDYEETLTAYYEKILKEEQPDVIHQWGTEFPNAWNMVQAASNLDLSDRIIVSIQGLIGVWGRKDLFYAELPADIIKKHSFKDYIRKNSLEEYREKYLRRAVYEKSVLETVKHVIGRTGFDRKETAAINPALMYHFNNETLREVFYDGRWSKKTCIPHRVFISQAGMPYKGFHLALAALGKLKKEYPDLTIAVTGRDLGSNISLKEKLKLSAYEQYIRKLINEYQLLDSIEFLGRLNAEQMKEQYLRANVFLLPSSIENSPNSLGEAMLLGVPTVAADVGGVRDLMTDEEEGMIYPWTDVDQMEGKLRRVFTEPLIDTVRRTEKARRHALKTHDPETNLEELMRIYRELSE